MVSASARELHPSVAHSSSYDDRPGGSGQVRIRSNGSEDTVATTDTTKSTDTRGSDGSRRRPGRARNDKKSGSGSGSGRRKGQARVRSLSPPHVPKGLKNVGNTCYANATLQCLLSTALTHALLDPSQAVIFRRYASNPNILAAGSGSVDSDLDGDEYEFAAQVGLGIDDDDDDDVIATPLPPSLSQSPDDSEKRKARLERRVQRREARKKAKEMQGMRETCQWLTGELTEITRDYTLQGGEQNQQHGPVYGDNQPAASASGMASGFLALFSFGNSNAPKAGNDKANTTIDPGAITRNVNKLCKTLRPYQQEDAHEFLRALLSTLTMAGQNRQLSSLFDGLLESAVTCQTCRYSSLTRDRYMDLSLDISNPSVTDLESALRHFTKTETLDESNMVTCTKCRTKRVVTKGLRLATAPTILVCHLKRFSCDMYGRLFRLSKDVAFPTRLELDGYMSRANRSTPPAYGLVGILVHAGQSCDSGHYFAFVKSGSRWYKCNDLFVHEVDLSVVLSQRAYVLVYEVEGMREKHGCETYGKYHSPTSSPMRPTNANLGSKKANKESNSGSKKSAKDKTSTAKKKKKKKKKKKVHMRCQSAPRPLREPSPMRREAMGGGPSTQSQQAPGKMRGGESADRGDFGSISTGILNLLDACAGTADSLCGVSSTAKDIGSKIDMCNHDEDDDEEDDDGQDDASDEETDDAGDSWDPLCDGDADSTNKSSLPPLAPSNRRYAQEKDSLDATWHATRSAPGNDTDSLDVTWHAPRSSRGNGTDSLDATWHASGNSQADPLDSTWHHGSRTSRGDNLDLTWHSRTATRSPPNSPPSPPLEKKSPPSEKKTPSTNNSRIWKGAGKKKGGPENDAVSGLTASGRSDPGGSACASSSNAMPSVPDLINRRSKSLSSAFKKANDSDDDDAPATVSPAHHPAHYEKDSVGSYRHSHSPSKIGWR